MAGRSKTHRLGLDAVKKHPITRENIREDVARVGALIQAHDQWERDVREKDIGEVDIRLKAVEGHYETLNRELGEVVGELKTIKWLVGGTLFAAAGALLKGLLGA